MAGSAATATPDRGRAGRELRGTLPVNSGEAATAAAGAAVEEVDDPAPAVVVVVATAGEMPVQKVYTESLFSSET